MELSETKVRAGKISVEMCMNNVKWKLNRILLMDDSAYLLQMKQNCKNWIGNKFFVKGESSRKMIWEVRSTYKKKIYVIKFGNLCRRQTGKSNLKPS